MSRIFARHGRCEKRWLFRNPPRHRAMPSIVPTSNARIGIENDSIRLGQCLGSLWSRATVIILKKINCFSPHAVTNYPVHPCVPRLVVHSRVALVTDLTNRPSTMIVDDEMAP